MPRPPSWTDEQLRAAVAAGRSLSDVLRALGLRPAGGNHASVSRHIARLALDTSHFDPEASRRAALARRVQRQRRPLDEVLTQRSAYDRGALKRRLFAEGLKARICELCGQGEVWRGRRMSLILDHINGIADDHRLENLQIVCPNCTATLDTHCGKNNVRRAPQTCARCSREFVARRRRKYCSEECRTATLRGEPQPQLRKVERPPHDQLLREIAESGYSVVGRRYGVSDNAVRKWVRWYERERERRERTAGPSGEG